VLLGTFSEFVEFDKQREKEGNRRSLGTTTKSRKTEPEAILDPKPAAGGGMGQDSNAFKAGKDGGENEQ
jgi:hypothetical protein